MRVVFVDNLLFEDFRGVRRYVLQPHLGLISLIAVLEREGHEGLLVDPKLGVSEGLFKLDGNLYQEIAKSIMATNPDAVGFTSLGCNFICTAKVAGYLRRWQPDLPILLGGPHASILSREILQHFPQFDLVVRNEAERKIVPTVAALENRDFDGIAGITFRSGEGVRINPGDNIVEDVNELPVPAYHRYPIRELALTTLRVDAGRGCPFQCTFCSTASFFGRKYRIKSADRLVEELDFLHAQYGVSDFALTHDLFTVNRRKILAFCEAVQTRNYTWKCSARMDCVDAELLDSMYAAGCRSIYFGIEAGSRRMQEISRKRLDLSLVDPTLDLTQRLGMATTISFITGYPEETLEDQCATLNLIGASFHRTCAPLNAQLHLLTPEPGTALLAQYQSDMAYDGHISDFNFPPLQPDDTAIMRDTPSVFINHHFFRSLLPRSRHIFVTTAYQALYGLGFPLLRHIIDEYGGKLSALLDRMDAWRLETGYSGTADESFVRRYFEAMHGSGSHLSGLVAYMLQAAELRRLASFESARSHKEKWNPKGCYRLSRRSAVVRNVPDCPRILERLSESNDKHFSPTRRSKRFDFLLRLRGLEEVENCVLTPACASLLEYFEKPRSVPGYRKTFRDETGYSAPSSSFLRTLFSEGTLESAGKPI
jgi:radical SAM superfamily enzyme YgiQ (UPF0313 family)